MAVARLLAALWYACACVVFQLAVAQRTVEIVEETLIGSNVTLNCQVPPGTKNINWILNSVIITKERSTNYPQYTVTGNDDDFNLFIQNVTLPQEGKVSCQGRFNETRRMGIITAYNLVVVVPPETVLVQSGSITRCMAGNQTMLNCSAYNAKPPVSLVWLLNGNEITKCTPGPEQNASAFGNTTCPLIVTPSRSDQSREYECRTSGKSLLTPVSVRTKLDVQYAPEIDLYVQPSDVVLQEDMPVSIICSAHSNPPPELWEWRINREKELHVSGKTFMIDRLNRKHHNATVLCTVYNTVDYSKKSLVLHVEYPPMFVHSNYVHKASVGETVTLWCAVDANPAATISWRRKNADGSVVDMASFGNLQTVTLQVDSSTFGEYICIAESGRFPGHYETSIYVLQKAAPQIRTVAQINAAVRSAAHIPCTIDAVPRPIVTWLRNNVPLAKDGRYSFNEEEFLGGLTSILTIDAVEKSDFGDYNCTALNELGSITRRIALSRIAETNVDLAIGGSVGALLALICILILSGIMLQQRRKKRNMQKNRQVRMRNDATVSSCQSSKFVGNPSQLANSAGCYERTTEFIEPLLHGSVTCAAPQGFANHKCVAFGNRTLYCATGGAYKMEPLPTESPSHRSLDQPWLPGTSPISYIQPDAIDNDQRNGEDAQNAHAHANLLISMSPSHCVHHVPITSITTVPHRQDEETNALGEEAKDDSSRSFDSGYGPGSANANHNHHGTPQIIGSANMHGSAVHVPHCSTLPGRHSLSQHATPCRDSKQLVLLPQESHPYFLPHCYSLRPHECLSNSNFPSMTNPDSPNPIWELDSRKPQVSRSGTSTLNRTSRHALSSMISVPAAMPPLSISPNLQECEERDDGPQESFNEVRGENKKENQQPLQYASVV